MTHKQLSKTVALVLLIIGSLTITSYSYPRFQDSKQNGSSQSECENKAPTPPVILPSHSESIRRAVCGKDAIKTVQPICPAEAKEKGIKGNVVVEIIIDEKGSVESSRCLSGPDVLIAAALKAAKKWKFRVTRINGKPVKLICALSFPFPERDITGKNKNEPEADERDWF